MHVAGLRKGFAGAWNLAARYREVGEDGGGGCVNVSLRMGVVAVEFRCACS